MPKSHAKRGFDWFPIPNKKVVDQEATSKARVDNPEAAPVFAETDDIDRMYVHKYVVNEPIRLGSMQAQGWAIWRDPETRETRTFGNQILLIKRRCDHEQERKEARDERRTREEAQRKQGMDQAAKETGAQTFGEKFERTQVVVK
jgi:hypothetical protein